MEKHRLTLLLAILMSLMCVAPALAVQAPAPFTDADIQSVSEGLATVGDYVAALAPTHFAWTYEGAATGVTYLTMRTESPDGAELGEATVAITLDDGAISGEEDGESTSLPEEVNTLDAQLVGARWLDASYALPLIRGVAPGASDIDVVAAFFSKSASEPSYTAQDINPAVDETWEIPEGAHIGGSKLEREDGGWDDVYGWCTLNEPGEWREYFLLTYHTLGGAVQSIELTYFTDPE